MLGIGIKVLNVICLDVSLAQMCEVERRKRLGGGFIFTISLRNISFGSAKGGVNGTSTNHLSSVSPSPRRKTMRKEIL
jgi:hypothetical protein